MPNPIWNNDWDGAALQLGDYLLEGSENSWFYVIRLHRSYDAKGQVVDYYTRVAPALTAKGVRADRIDLCDALGATARELLIDEFDRLAKR